MSVTLEEANAAPVNSVINYANSDINYIKFADGWYRKSDLSGRDDLPSILREGRGLGEEYTLTTPIPIESVLEDELTAFKSKVVRVARRYAEDNNWCEVVDRALKELGLLEESAEYKVGDTFQAWNDNDREKLIPGSIVVSDDGFSWNVLEDGHSGQRLATGAIGNRTKYTVVYVPEVSGG